MDQQAEIALFAQLHTLPARLSRWARELFSAHLCCRVDPVILAAIMDRESLGGEALDSTGRGDGGHGHGLMQIDDRYHAAFIASGLWKKPAHNILYGAGLVADNLEVFDSDYPCAIAAYNCGQRKVRHAIDANIDTPRMALIDGLTSGGNYVSDVFRRRDNFLHRPDLGPQWRFKP